MRVLSLATVLLVAVILNGQSAPPGYHVEKPRTDEDGIPLGAARLCIEPSSNVCYTPPAEEHGPPFGLKPEARTIMVKGGHRLVLFSAESYAGGSGRVTKFALLDIHDAKISNLLPDVALSNQSELRIWKNPTGTEMPLVVTADFSWAKEETHFSRHRYQITTYAYDVAGARYLERDRFITSRTYPGLDDVETIKVLEAEKQTVFDRLKRPAKG